MAVTQDACRQLFLSDVDESLADKIEAEAPAAACELFSVSHGSLGPVESIEQLLRILTSPRDVDPSGAILERPFHKIFKNGLSVMRDRASDAELREYMDDCYTDGQQLFAVLQLAAKELRGLQQEGNPCIGIYDQLASRSSGKPPFPSHGNVFLHRPLPRTPDRKKLQRDLAGEVRKLFERVRFSAENFRDGLLVKEPQPLSEEAAPNLEADDD